MNSVSPVLTEAEISAEQVIALDQPKFYPIIIARIIFPEDQSIASVTRFRFTEEEKKLIAAGADLIVSQPHHGSMIMPIALQLAMPDQYPCS